MFGPHRHTDFQWLCQHSKEETCVAGVLLHILKGRAGLLSLCFSVRPSLEAKHSENLNKSRVALALSLQKAAVICTVWRGFPSVLPLFARRLLSTPDRTPGPILLPLPCSSPGHSSIPASTHHHLLPFRQESTRGGQLSHLKPFSQ